MAPFCLVPGLSRNREAGLNIVDLRRAGLKLEERRQIRSAFHILYRSGLNVAQAVVRLEGQFPSGPARGRWEFVKTSSRGICGWKAHSDADGDATSTAEG